MVVTGIGERRGRLSWDKCVHMGRAIGHIVRYGSRRDNDQAVAWVRVPARAGHHPCRADRLPDVALQV